MNHRIGGRKFGLPSDQRRALLKGLVRALLTYQTIKTTETRAKDVRSIAEKLITDARVDTLHARRQARRFLTMRPWCIICSRRSRRSSRTCPGGFTRTVKIGQRRGDAATIVQLSLVTDRDSACRSSRTRSGSRAARPVTDRHAHSEADRRVRRHGLSAATRRRGRANVPCSRCWRDAIQPIVAARAADASRGGPHRYRRSCAGSGGFVHDGERAAD